MNRALVIIVMTVLIAARLTPAGGASDTMKAGRDATRMFYAGETSALWGIMTADMQAALVSESNLESFRRQVAEELGEELAVYSETVQEAGAFHVYLRTVRFELLERPVHVQFAFDDGGMIGGFYIRPVQEAAPSDYLDYETKTPLMLPFEGEWDVFWGGRTIDVNYHVVAPDQRFAYDILIMDKGSTHTGDGKRNEDYYCFGRPVFAPGDGVVHASANDVEDNAPGVLNPRQALGNYVIIDHQNGEYSFLAHLRKGSVSVKKGDKLAAGDLVGLCGNSGNTTEPHIHYHLQSTPEFGHGDGLPAQFLDYTADGKLVARGEPVKGQRIGRHKQ